MKKGIIVTISMLTMSVFLVACNQDTEEKVVFIDGPQIEQVLPNGVVINQLSEAEASEEETVVANDNQEAVGEQEVADNQQADETDETEAGTEEQVEVPEEVSEESTDGYTYTNETKVMYARISMNVRDIPSTEGKKLGGLKRGQEINVTGVCNETGWYRFDYEGTVAYVSNELVTDVKPSAQPVVVEQPVEQPAPEVPAEPPVAQ